MNEHEIPRDAESRVADEEIAALVERAFHYRGDVTLQVAGGDSLTGYLYNRTARGADPFAQLFETGSGRDIAVPYRSITGVVFSGRDAAAAAVERFNASQSLGGKPARDEPAERRSQGE